MPPRRLPAPFRQVAQSPERRFARHLFPLYFGRGFDRVHSRRVLILYEPNRISYASVYPFVMYARAFARRFDAQMRLYPVRDALGGGLPARFASATHVIALSWLTDPMERHQRLADLLRSAFAGARTAYLDTFANADIRLARVFSDVDVYFKKSLFADRTQHLRATLGHTNLAEYYGALLDEPQARTDWQVPATVLPKLRLAPNFLTAPGLADAFLRSPAAPAGPRTIDLHARLGGTDSPGWYGAMRRAAETAATNARLRTVTGTGIPRDRFMAELRASRLCFSPFGYGEVCWRDIEAILAGAVLLKPDMRHLSTSPDLYRDGETHVALKWDFSDLAEKAQALLDDEERRSRMARNAYAAARRYLFTDGPVNDYAPLFD